jgi:hypothetical protein
VSTSPQEFLHGVSVSLMIRPSGSVPETGPPGPAGGSRRIR